MIYRLLRCAAPLLMMGLLCSQAWRSALGQTGSVVWATQGTPDGMAEGNLGYAPAVDLTLAGWFDGTITSTVVTTNEAQLDSIFLWLSLAENPQPTQFYVEVWRQDTGQLVATSGVNLLQYFNGAFTTEFGFSFAGVNRINLVPGTGYSFVLRGTGQGAGTLLASASSYQGQYAGQFFEIYGVPPESYLFSLVQEKPNGTPFQEGRGLTEQFVVFSAGVESASQVDPAQLQIELQPFGTAFTGIANLTSGFVPAGTVASVASGNLADGQYHWQARVVDPSGNASAWQEFGTAGNVDFVVAAHPPGIAADFSDGQFPNGYCGHGTVAVVPDIDLQVTSVDFWAICANGSCIPPNDFQVWSGDGSTLLATSDGAGSYFGYPNYAEITQTFSGANQITLHAGQTYRMTPFSANGTCDVDTFDGTTDTFYLRGVQLYGPVTVSAGQNQNVKVETTAVLAGSATATGCAPSLLWTFVTKPPGSNATLSGAATAAPSFVPDVQGMYTLQLTGTCGSSSGVATVVVNATDCSGVVLSASPKNPPALAGQTLQLQGYGGSGSYQWALVQPANGSLAGTAGSGVSYTAGSAAGVDVVQMSDALCATTLAIQITVTTTGPVLVTAIDPQPNPTSGAGTVSVSATFSKPANAARLCLDGSVSCQTMTLAGGGATSATFIVSTDGLAGGDHTVSVQAADAEGLGPPLGTILTVGTPYVLLLRGYDFAPCDSPTSAAATGAGYWRSSLFSSQNPPVAQIECQIQNDFFGASPSCASGAVTSCPDDTQPDSPHDHVCVVDTLNGKEAVEDNVAALTSYISRRSYLANAQSLILIGHSYGGMIARAYAACGAGGGTPCPQNVGAILTLDTPHLGAQPLELAIDQGLHAELESLVTEAGAGAACPASTWWQDAALPNFYAAQASTFNAKYPPRNSPATRIYPIGTQRQYTVVDLPTPSLSLSASVTASAQVTTTFSGSDDIVDLASQEWLPGADDQANLLNQQGGKVQPAQVVPILPSLAPPAIVDLLLAILQLTPQSNTFLHSKVIANPAVWAALYEGAVKTTLCTEINSTVCQAGAGRDHIAGTSSAGRDATLSPAFDLRPASTLGGSLTAVAPSASVPVMVDGATDLTLSVLTDGADPLVTAADPNGTVYSALSVDNLASQYQVTSSGTQNRQTLILHRPIPGTWTLNVAAANGGAGPNVSPAGASWTATVAMRSPIRLRVNVAALSYLVGDTLAVSATLDENGTAMTGAALTATLTPVAGGAAQTFSLYDDGAHGDGAAGDGVYGGTTTLGAPGAFVLAVTAAGSSDLGQYQRYQSGTVAIGTPQVTLNGGFTESAPDVNGNGLFDSVNWSFAIDVPAAGHYVAFGDLAAPDGTVVASAETAIDPTASGPQALTLVFSGQQLYHGGRPGPYSLQNLRVTMETAAGPQLAGRFSPTVVTTGPYWSWLVFESDASPGFTWVSPVTITATSASSFLLAWSLADGNGATTIDLFYDQVGSGFDGVPIVAGLGGVNGSTSYTWDMSALADGIYYVYALVRNGAASQAVYGGSVQKVTDSDGDGMPDAWETAHGLNPHDAGDAYMDPDGDGLSNVEEYRHGTDPQVADADGGGESDGSEVDNGRDPTNAGDDVRGVSVTAVAPGIGDSRGGDQVMLLGSGFQAGATVTFGSTPATRVTFVSSSRLFAITPPNGIGQVDVTVSNPGGAGGATLSGAFGFLCEFVEPPTVSSNAPLCPGQGLQLTATGLAGATYSWNGPNGFSSNLQNPTLPQATTAASGVYTVTLQAGSCSLAASTTVVVSAPAGPAPANSGPACAGQNVQLTAAGIANATYQWSGPGGYASSAQNPVLAAAPAAASGAYSVTATVNGCVSQAATTNVVVRSLPTAVVSGSAQSCAGASNTIQATLTGAAPWAVSWSDGASEPAIAASPASRVVQPASTTTYTVTSVADSYCTGTASGAAVITVNTPAPPTAGNSGPACAGQNVQLTAGAVAGATSYSWQGPGGFSSSSQNPLLSGAQPAASGTYSVSATVGGCNSQPATTNVLVRTLPTALVSGSQQICPAGQASIHAALTGEAPWRITWSDGNVQTGIAASPDARVVMPGTATSYSVAAVTDAFCQGTASGSAVITLGGHCNTSFHTLEPCRIVDTRGAAGAYGGPALLGGEARSFTLAGQCGIPASAKAVALNITIVDATAPGYLSVYPADDVVSTSTMNFKPGQVRANNAICALGTDGAVTVLFGQTSAASVHLLLDASGYFE
jgi:PGAP1-like protein/IPT/TIG domain/Bacterial TSP3 repeat